MIFGAGFPPGRAVFIALAIIAIGAILVAIMMANATRHRAHLEQIARKYGGHLEGGTMLAFPKMRFQHAGRTVLLSFASDGSDDNRMNTSLSINRPQPKLRCEIYPEPGFSAHRRLLGMQDIEICSPHFDD